ncbi:hypothetical protein FKW77_004831 [Venturia effusa]|uniref:Heterokaryon incompatibility domain-containing protein n=1 Tax=Venturia effusa TaxID=50376 RepID=A0A517LQA6_9PEZI|nr:hypothetical protein FKW77_004831 [Venturia effusa]
MSDYAYKPLNLAENEIRVIKILPPGSTTMATDLVHVSISHVSLEDLRPEFEQFVANEAQPFTFEVAKPWIQREIPEDCSNVSKFSSWRLFTGLDLRQDLVGILGIDSTNLPDFLDLGRNPPPPIGEVPVSHRFNWGDFEALSYCWESDVCEKDVLVDGSLVQIPKNLEAMLQKLQYLPEVESGMHFWIDGLCIDQNNISEKNHQVQLMKRIYTEALCVIVWLGDGDDESDQAMDALARIAGFEQQVEEKKSRLSKETLDNRRRQSIRDWMSAISWAPVVDLLSRNYWKRMWIIQELALNHTMTLFMCGNRQVPRQVVWGACGFIEGWSREIDQALIEQCRASSSSIPTDHDIFQIAYDVYSLFMLDLNAEIHSFDRLLDLARKSKVKDPKDKVYGLLGLLAQPIAPDYRKSIMEIYMEFGMVILQNSTRLDGLLSWCNFEKESLLPSWTPDWEKPFKRRHMQWFRKWQAGGNCDPTWSASRSGRSLQVRGVLLDVVKDVSYTPCQNLPYRKVRISNVIPFCTPKTFGRYENFTILKKAMHRTMLHAHQITNEASSLLEIYWVSWDEIEASDAQDLQLSDFWTYGMAPVCGDMRLNSWKEVDRFRQTNASFSIFGHPFKDLFPDMRQYRVESLPVINNACLPGQENPVPRKHTPHELTEHHFRNMRIANVGLRGRRLITTKTGFLGLAAKQVDVDDVIAVLYGCNFPVVLRPHGIEYKYIGECYIDGIMNGEALEAQKRGDLREVEIMLC